MFTNVLNVVGCGKIDFFSINNRKKNTMIRSVVYKRTNITFPLNCDLIDGNVTFDDISVSNKLRAVIRFNHGSLWYKIYSSKLFENIDEKQKNISELDAIVTSFIERKTKSFQNISFEKL